MLLPPGECESSGSREGMEEIATDPDPPLATVRRGSVLGSFASAVASLSSGADVTSTQSMRSRHGTLVTAKFVGSERGSSAGIHGAHDCRSFVMHARKSSALEGFLSVIVVLDQVLTIMVIDTGASGKSSEDWVKVASYVCLVAYSIELMMAFYALRRDAFRDGWVILDILFLVAGCVELLIDLIMQDREVPALRMMRTLRILRLSKMQKALKRFPMLKELSRLVVMTASCLRTLLWSLLFCFVVMTAWSMLAMETVRPVFLQIADQNGWDECGDACVGAMDTVMLTNLLLFKTIIAGDSWGQIAIPVIRQQPFTAIVFCGALLTLVFGVLNLVVAVIVDTFAEQREKDVKARAEEMEAAEEEDVYKLTKIFREIDEDASGEVTLDELLAGASCNQEFNSRLRVMDIDAQDLTQLFHMLDSDGGGSIDSNEFISALSRWINESKTATRFVKYNVEKSMRILCGLSDDLAGFQASTLMQLGSVAQDLVHLREESSRNASILKHQEVLVAGSELRGCESEYDMQRSMVICSKAPCGRGEAREDDVSESCCDPFASTYDTFSADLRLLLEQGAAPSASPKASSKLFEAAVHKLSMLLQEVRELVGHANHKPRADSLDELTDAQTGFSIPSPIAFPKSTRVVRLTPSKKSSHKQDEAVMGMCAAVPAADTVGTADKQRTQPTAADTADTHPYQLPEDAGTSSWRVKV
eukprot:TRINITY_DN33957_c0_g1_i1.p1 TRINITY_DN33957_c0_g1~~TRINITY_DN33957_c0_g1_i1.p1  ORF type:complete len:703 (-),score=100.56 TRINITY_DN33957_c0_g1_i1:65-2173(-)